MLRQAWRPMRERGLAGYQALLWYLPSAALLRAWRALAGPLNARVLGPWLNARRFARFQDGLPATPGLRLYLIVMPDTLHFLLPCVALLRGQAPIVLLANGARPWELRLLQKRFPELPLFRLRCLPWSSQPHGDVLSLLIEHQRGDFAVVDHDAYVFDPALLQKLQPGPGECVVASFALTGQRCGFDVPLTHVLSLRAEALRTLMHAHRVDARQYRKAPRTAIAALQRIGLGEQQFFKDYQRFHDTLHVLLAVALAQGWKVRTLPQDEALPVFHIGGTSIGSHHTKSLFALYVHLRFLELVDDAEIWARYRFMVHPLRSAAELLARPLPADPAWAALPVLDALMLRLAAAFPSSSSDHQGARP
ncbi:hypothetical protein [Paucibacter soli]|uniref:hypothetical protein n=1 Tax=Paucibacter soli TaxID=3133433 RepID=UPI0030A5A216